MHADYGVGLALNSWRAYSIPSWPRCCCSGCRQGRRRRRRRAAAVPPRKSPRRRWRCAGGRRAGDPRTSGSGQARSPSPGLRAAGALAARSATCPRRHFSVHPSRGSRPEFRGGTAELREHAHTLPLASVVTASSQRPEAWRSARGIRWGLLSEATAKRTNPKHDTPASSAAVAVFRCGCYGRRRLSPSYPSLRSRSRRTNRRCENTHTQKRSLDEAAHFSFAQGTNGSRRSFVRLSSAFVAAKEPLLVRTLALSRA